MTAFRNKTPEQRQKEIDDIKRHNQALVKELLEYKRIKKDHSSFEIKSAFLNGFKWVLIPAFFLVTIIGLFYFSAPLRHKIESANNVCNHLGFKLHRHHDGEVFCKDENKEIIFGGTLGGK